MQNKLLLIQLITICYCSNVTGQDQQKLALPTEAQAKVDSLWNVFKQSKHDTTRIKILNEEIGYVYKNYSPDTAIMYYNQAISISDKVLGSGYTPTIRTESAEVTIPNIENRIFSHKANSLRYIGSVHRNQGSYDKAIEYYLKALKIFEKLGDKNGIAEVYGNIAGLNICLSDSAALSEGQRWNYLNNAVEYANKSYVLALEIGAVPKQKDATAYLQKAYTKLGKYKEAIKYAEIFIETQDSMFSEEKTKAIAQMQAQYEAEKRELIIDNLSKENALKQAELAQSEEKRSKQLILIYSFVAGFIIILVFSIVIFRLFMQKKKANLLLKRQKQQIEEQKKEIDDSIQYAKQIQTAVLLTDKYADSILGEHFIIFRPHSVVSGDFYWATRVNDWLIVTAADCTGHGVPGAFLSMLGVSFLNEIVRKKEVTNAADVLNDLRTSIIDALKQTGDTSASFGSAHFDKLRTVQDGAGRRRTGRSVAYLK